MTVAEYAKRAGVSVVTIRNYIRAGKLKAKKVPGRTKLRWEINGHHYTPKMSTLRKRNGTEASEPDVLETIASTFPSITLSNALKIRSVLRG